MCRGGGECWDVPQGRVRRVSDFVCQQGSSFSCKITCEGQLWLFLVKQTQRARMLGIAGPYHVVQSTGGRIVLLCTHALGVKSVTAGAQQSTAWWLLLVQIVCEGRG